MDVNVWTDHLSTTDSAQRGWIGGLIIRERVIACKLEECAARQRLQATLACDLCNTRSQVILYDKWLV